jgi:DNA polymerase III epsilon subunit-like protein
MKALLLDVETTGTNPETDKVIELAGLLYDTDHGVVWVKSELYEHDENPAIAVNGIAPVLSTGARKWPGTGTPLPQWASSCRPDCFVSHGMFDSRWFSDEHRPWVDTCDGFEWPRMNGSRGLAAVALAHGVGVLRAHRAFDDVLTLATCFDRLRDMGVDLAALLTQGSRPRVFLEGIPAQKYANDPLKAARFRFDPERKRWVRWAFTDEVFPFRTREVSP